MASSPRKPDRPQQPINNLCNHTREKGNFFVNDSIVSWRRLPWGQVMWLRFYASAFGTGRVIAPVVQELQSGHGTVVPRRCQAQFNCRFVITVLVVGLDFCGG